MDDIVVRSPGRTHPAVNVALLVATLATTIWTGFYLAGAQGGAIIGAPAAQAARSLVAAAWAGLPFAGAIVGILLSHEMGHYLLARRHRVDATLPFFIPFLPFFPLGIGTLGAVIRLRSRMPSRRAVLDIGAAGPIAGFVVAVPLLLWGYAHSAPAPPDLGSPLGVESPLRFLLHLLRGSPADPEGSGQVIVFGRSLLTWAALRLTHPALPSGAEVIEHPVAIAAWFGLYVTTINLLPVGQLDGGHVLYALLGRERAQRASRLVSWALLGMGLAVSWTWLAWWALTRVLVGTHHPPAVVEEPLTPGRKAVAALALVLFVATFTPIPIR
jgi:membrane-associated protease RseP (regulator of RpoE activity)